MDVWSLGAKRRVRIGLTGNRVRQRKRSEVCVRAVCKFSLRFTHMA